MGTNIYMGLLGLVFAAAVLAGTYHLVPPWLVWLLGIALALLVGAVALIVLGRRILRGDFDGGQKEAGNPRIASSRSSAQRADD